MKNKEGVQISDTTVLDEWKHVKIRELINCHFETQLCNKCWETKTESFQLYMCY